MGVGAIRVAGGAGSGGAPTVLGAEAVYNVARIDTESTDERPDDLGQFAALLVLLAAVASWAVVRGDPRPTVVRVMAVTVGASLVIGTAVSQVI